MPKGIEFVRFLRKQELWENRDGHVQLKRPGFQVSEIGTTVTVTLFNEQDMLLSGLVKYNKSRWWFQRFFFFTTIPGEMIQFDESFSDGLKPPTRQVVERISADYDRKHEISISICHIGLGHLNHPFGEFLKG